ILFALCEEGCVARPKLLVERLEVAHASTEATAFVPSVVEDDLRHSYHCEAARRESHPEIPVLDPAAHLPAAGLKQKLSSEQGNSRRRAHVGHVPRAERGHARDMRRRSTEALQIAPRGSDVRIRIECVRKYTCGATYQDVVGRERHDVRGGGAG